MAGYRLRYVVYAPVLEEWLRLILHLYYDLLALVGLAIDVVNQRPVFLKQCRLLLVEECKVDDMFLSLKQTVEEIKQ